jgi:hypothetical protein
VAGDYLWRPSFNHTLNVVLDHGSCDNNDLVRSNIQKKELQLLQLQKEEEGMALIVSLAHTGQRLQADPASFAS